MDHEVYRYSLAPHQVEECMSSKCVDYAVDINSGQYQTQIQFDLKNFCAGRYIDWSQAYIEVPYYISIYASVAQAQVGGLSAFAAQLKNGSYQIIDSVSMEINGTQVIQPQQYLNMLIGWNLMSTFSTDDLKKWGDIIGFAPDSAGSFVYSAASTVDGVGITNNRLGQVARSWANTEPLETINQGALQRAKNMAFPNIAGVTGYAGNAELSASNVSQIGKNSFIAATANGQSFLYSTILILRLKDLVPLMDRMCLVKGMDVRLTLNFNACSFSIVAAGVGANNLLAAPTDYSQIAGKINPVLVSSAAANNPLNGLTAATLFFQAGVSGTPRNTQAAWNAALGGTSLPLTACRLYAPNYILRADAERALIERPIKKIAYSDYYNFNFPNTVSGASFTQILSTAIKSPKLLIIIPYVSAQVSPANNTYLSELISPFTSSPGTTSPMPSLINFNVQIAGKSVFQSQYDYGFQNFMDEVSRSGLNGGEVTGLMSGLIGKFEWENGFQYYICDLSRRALSDVGIPKGCTIYGRNNTTLTLDLFCFITYERELEIDCTNGKLLSVSSA